MQTIWLTGRAILTTCAALAFASTAAAQETTYIDCKATGEAKTFALDGASLRFWSASRAAWIDPCAPYNAGALPATGNGTCQISVNAYKVNVRSTVESWVFSLSIDRTTGAYEEYWPRDGTSRGKCVRAENPATKPRAF